MLVTRFNPGTSTTPMSLKDTCGTMYTINTGNIVGAPSYDYYVLPYWYAMGLTYSTNYPMSSVSPYLTNIQYSYLKYYDNATAPE